MTTWRKGFTFLLVGLMVTTGLVALFSAPVVLADEDLMGTTTQAVSALEIYIPWEDARMTDDLAVDADDEPIVYNYNTASLYYLGDDDVALRVTIDNMLGATTNASFWQTNRTWNNTDIVSTIVAPAGSLVMPGDTSTVTIDGDTNVIPNGVYWHGGPMTNINGDNATAWNPGVALNLDFTLDIGDIGDVETAYPLTLFVEYRDDNNVARNESVTIEVYVSTIWHENANDADRDYPFPFVYYDINMAANDLTYVYDTNDDEGFEAGDMFEPAAVDLWAEMKVIAPKATLTAPTDDNSGDGVADFELVSGVSKIYGAQTGTVVSFLYRVNVQSQTPPGVTVGTIMFDYEIDRNGYSQMITENARPIDFIVDFNFEADIDVETYNGADSGELLSITDVTLITDDVVTPPVTNTTNTTKAAEDVPFDFDIPVIQQGIFDDQIIEFEVEITNNGNQDLHQLNFMIDPTGWTYFENPTFFYDPTAVSADTLEFNVPLLPMGESVDVPFFVNVLSDIPVGEHRLPITYTGFFFNGGELFTDTQYVAINGGDALETQFALFVEDDTPEFGPGAVVFAGADKGNIVSEVMTVNILNNEMYDFSNAIVTVDLTGTPFYNPIIDPATGVPIVANKLVEANEANMYTPLGTWAPGNQAFTFTVDTDPSYVPDRYTFVVMIDATIAQTGDAVTSTVYFNGIDFSGYGPEIFINAFTAEDIIPGEMFVLDLTLENVGDETLRDVTVVIGTDGTDPAYWDVEQEFKYQFDWSEVFSNWGSETGGQVAWEGEFPSDMFYTVEDLDIDNVREIYELNLYVDGIYSVPSARISVIHILDLAPGATTDVSFDMYADKDMVNGKPYVLDVHIDGIESDGGIYEENREITVMSSLPGSSYNPVELDWFDAGIKALGLFLFFIIVLAILLFVYNMFKGDPYDEDEDDFDFEDDDEPDFEPTPEPVDEAPEVQSEELVEP